MKHARAVDHVREPGAARLQRAAGEIVSIQVEEIERVEHDRVAAMAAAML